MRYSEFQKVYNPLQGDPLVAWFDDPSTTVEDMMEFLGPGPFQEHPEPTSNIDKVIGK
jgi:hypothetical protein